MRLDEMLGHDRPSGMRAEGDPNSPLVLVLEHLTHYDVREGKLLSGPPGGVMSLCLQNVMLPRSSMHITTLFNTPTDRRQLSRFYDSRVSKKKRTAWFTKKGLAYKEGLIEHLKELKPKLIVASGDATIYALTGNIGQLTYRGSTYWNSEIGCWVLCTMNPGIAAYGNKKSKSGLEGRTEVSPYIYRYYITSDLRKAKRYVEHGVPRSKKEFKIEPTLDEALTFIDYLGTQPRFAFDIEVTNYQVSCISFCADPNFSMSIPFDKRWREEEEDILWLHIADLMGDDTTTKIAHNTMFDVWFLALQNKIITRGRLEDTMTAHHIMYPDMHKGLDFITSVYTDEPYYKDEGKIWHLDKVSYEDLQNFWRYNAKDSAVTMECWLKFEKEIDNGWRKIYDATMRRYQPLLFWMLRGMKVDAEAIKENKVITNKQIEEKTRELQEIAGEPLNPNSPKQVQEYFYDRLGIPPYYNTKQTAEGPKKVPTTDDKAMARLARGTSTRPPLREASLIQEIRGLIKLRGTYLEIDYDEDGRLRCAVNPRGTTTGRLSTGKTIPFGTGMNMQNLPPAFKNFIQPDDGYALIELDKRQAEWVASAYIFDDPAMQQVVEQGLDPHASTIARMVGLDLEYIPWIKEEDKLIGHTADPVFIKEKREQAPRHIRQMLNKCTFVPRTMSLRQCGKKSNHGLNYGETYKMFALINEIMEKEAKMMTEEYHAVYPGIQQGHKRIQDILARENRTLYSCGGIKRLKRVFRDRWGDDLFKECYAFIPQSSVALLVLEAIEDAYYDEPEFMQKCEFLCQVHDSVIFQYPIEDDYNDLAKAIIRWAHFLDKQLTYHNRPFKIHTDMKISTRSWGHMNEVSLEGNLVHNIQEALEHV